MSRKAKAFISNTVGFELGFEEGFEREVFEAVGTAKSDFQSGQAKSNYKSGQAKAVVSS